jgi:hypothetical protein
VRRRNFYLLYLDEGRCENRLRRSSFGLLKFVNLLPLQLEPENQITALFIVLGFGRGLNRVHSNSQCIASGGRQ